LRTAYAGGGSFTHAAGAGRMHNDSQRAYLERRRDEELQRAAVQQDEGLRALHLRWAQLYQQRLNGQEPGGP